MALPAPEETLMGVAQYNPRKKQAPVVPIRVERRAPPKVLKKPGMTEWVGTQKPTEQQKPEETMAAKTQKRLTLKEWARKTYGGTAGFEAGKSKSDPYGTVLRGLEVSEDNEFYGEKKVEMESGYKNYTKDLKKANTQTKANVAGYNSSVKTYNQAIGHKTPAENKAIAERLLKKTQPKTVMA